MVTLISLAARVQLADREPGGETKESRQARTLPGIRAADGGPARLQCEDFQDSRHATTQELATDVHVFAGRCSAGARSWTRPQAADSANGWSGYRPLDLDSEILMQDKKLT